MNKIFTGGFDLSRVRPGGLILMAAGVLLAVLAGKLAARSAKKEGLTLLLKLVGFAICAGGALVAIL